MDLLCLEKPVDCEFEVDEDFIPATFTRIYPDPVLLDDERVLQSLLHTEDKCVITSSYFKCVQKELKPNMRTTVAGWMLEICEDQCCQEGVFSLAMNYMDRFLSIVTISRCQLQLLGAVCLFLASKLKDSRPLSAEKLCKFSDNAFTLHHITSWELLVLGKLKWDMWAITPHDFVDYILRRLPSDYKSEKIKRHAQTLMAICATDFRFSLHTPSIIAAASILSAIRGLTEESKRREEVNSVIAQLHTITHIETDVLRSCLEQLEAFVNQIVETRLALANANATNDFDSLVILEKLYKEMEDCDHELAETPTDVRDIHF